MAQSNWWYCEMVALHQALHQAIKIILCRAVGLLLKCHIQYYMVRGNIWHTSPMVLILLIRLKVYHPEPHSGLNDSLVQYRGSSVPYFQSLSAY